MKGGRERERGREGGSEGWWRPHPSIPHYTVTKFQLSCLKENIHQESSMVFISKICQN